MNKIKWFNFETRPVRLFRDSDRDGVPNIFDCRPFDPSKQDGLSNEHPSNEERRRRWQELKEKGFSADQARRARDFRPTTYNEVIHFRREIYPGFSPTLEELRKKNKVSNEEEYY